LQAAGEIKGNRAKPKAALFGVARNDAVYTRTKSWVATARARAHCGRVVAAATVAARDGQDFSGCARPMVVYDFGGFGPQGLFSVSVKVTPWRRGQQKRRRLFLQAKRFTS
jgi:hypothetical protein